MPDTSSNMRDSPRQPAIELMTTIARDYARQKPPSPQSQPVNAGGRCSTRVYPLTDFPLDNIEEECEVQRPQHARVSSRDSRRWPRHSVITVSPNEGLFSTDDSSSKCSDRDSLDEMHQPPRQLLDSVEACGPGTYTCTVTGVDDYAQQSADVSLDTGDEFERSSVVTFHIHRADIYNHVIAKQIDLDRLCQKYPLPQAKASKWWLKLRYNVFSTYRRLFLIAVIANLIAICCMAVRRARDPSSFTLSDSATAVAANLFAGTLIRNEHCVNFIFRRCVSLPLWVPVRIRALAAKVYSYGGIHSGCGFSALLWYIFFTALVCVDLDANDAVQNAVAVLTAFVDLILLALVVGSYPLLRAKYHDAWELSHRYLGWAAVAAVWAQMIVIFVYEAKVQARSAGVIVIESPAFWFLIGINFLIVYPWLRLRRVKVDVERLSNHAARIRFPNHQRRMTACVGTKISVQPLLDNHSFATIADPGGEKGYSVLVSNAGDFTNKLVNNPPKYVWKRGAPVIGVMRLAQLFKPIVVVATGSGIGPCLSFLETHPGWPVRIVWSTRMPEATYGIDMLERVLAADHKAVIVDTHKTGHGDILGLVYAVYKESNAEAVVAISNPRVSYKITFGLESRNVPAFAPIFDS